MSDWLLIILITDLILFVVLFFVLYRMYVTVTQKFPREVKQKLAELRSLVASSEKAADDFYAKGEETIARFTSALEGITRLEEQLSRQMSKAAQTMEAFEIKKNASPYDEVISLLKRGTPLEEIRHQGCLPEAEINLIVELFQRQESIPPHQETSRSGIRLAQE